MPATVLTMRKLVGVGCDDRVVGAGAAQGLLPQRPGLLAGLAQVEQFAARLERVVGAAGEVDLEVRPRPAERPGKAAAVAAQLDGVDTVADA